MLCAYWHDNLHQAFSIGSSHSHFLFPFFLNSTYPLCVLVSYQNKIPTYFANIIAFFTCHSLNKVLVYIYYTLFNYAIHL